MRKFTAVHGRGEGGSGEKGGGGGASTTMSIQTLVNFRHFLSSLLLNKSLSNLTILLLGPCHKLKKTVKGSFNKSFSYTVNFNLLCQSRQLTYHDFFNQHTVVTCLKTQLVFFPECYNTKPTFLFY